MPPRLDEAAAFALRPAEKARYPVRELLRVISREIVAGFLLSRTAILACVSPAASPRLTSSLSSSESREYVLCFIRSECITPLH